MIISFISALRTKTAVMYQILKSGVSRMAGNKKRIASWLIFIVFCFVIFGSAFFIITHADHDCTGGECSVCTELAECHRILNTSGTAFSGGIQLSVMIFALCLTAGCFTETRTDHSTLISLKVELLN